MAFLVGCIVTCENAPRTVIIPATAKTTVRKLMRRFILCLPSNDPPSLPREFSTQSSLQQAPVGPAQLVPNIPFSDGFRTARYFASPEARRPAGASSNRSAPHLRFQPETL